MNEFYKQPLLLLWIESVILMIVGFYPAILIIEAAYNSTLFYFLFLVYIPIGQFCLTPLFRLTGIYKYYSPMLLGYMANNIKIDLHSGGSFDYLFVMRKLKTGVESRNRLLIYHLQGLLNIIVQLESGLIPKTVIISGTSYFFNQRTITRLGFEQSKPSLFYIVNLYANFIDLIWMFSVSRGKFSIPKLWQAKKVSIEGHKLLDKKIIIESLYNKMYSDYNNRIGFA